MTGKLDYKQFSQSSRKLYVSNDLLENFPLSKNTPLNLHKILWATIKFYDRDGMIFNFVFQQNKILLPLLHVACWLFQVYVAWQVLKPDPCLLYPVLHEKEATVSRGYFPFTGSLEYCTFPFDGLGRTEQVTARTHRILIWLHNLF